MKKQNIAFTGVMATILLSAGAANAATATKIASQAYVEGQVSTINKTLTDNYYTKTAADSAIDAKITAATTAENGAVKTITDALNARIDELESSTPTDATVAGKADKIKNLTAADAGKIAIVKQDGQYELSDKKIADLATAGSVTTLTETVEGINTTVTEHTTTLEQLPGTIKETVVKELGGTGTETVTEVVEKTIVEQLGKADSELSQTIDGKLDDKADKVANVTAANAGGIATVAVGGQYEMSTTKLADLATTAALKTVSDKVDDNASAIETLNGDATVAGSVASKIADAVKADGAIDAAVDTKIETELGENGAISGAIDDKIADSVKENGDVFNAMIPRPAAGVCDSGLCVLSVNDQGGLTWVNVTEPLE